MFLMFLTKTVNPSLTLSLSLSLTVSALQVKPVELTDFLQLKKSEGYCIVGVEQTANSRSLQDYQFPEKTLLLLGYDTTEFFAKVKVQSVFFFSTTLCECIVLPCDSSHGQKCKLTMLFSVGSPV